MSWQFVDAVFDDCECACRLSLDGALVADFYGSDREFCWQAAKFFVDNVDGQSFAVAETTQADMRAAIVAWCGLDDDSEALWARR